MFVMPALQLKLSSRAAPITVGDFRAVARRRVPGMVWSYIDGGAEDLVTLRANRSAFAAWSLRSRVLTGNRATDLTVDIAGSALSVPVILAPTGMTGLAHWTGEVGAAQAAERAGTRAVISTAASYTPEEVAEATAENHFFQLYPWASAASGARELSRSFINRAQQAGYQALFVTVDVPVHGNREGERRQGMQIPPVLTPARLLNAATKPRWCYHFLKEQRTSARLLVDKGGTAAAVKSALMQYRFMRPELNWDDFSWMREEWRGPLYIKGVLDPDDAARAVDLGADGVVVSNHGGRQLDGAPASLAALPAVVDRVGQLVPVLFDGGIRRGSDIVKALCLGARAVLIGRPYVYGLAADGAAGVERVIEILKEELKRTMTLMGVSSIGELDRSLLIENRTGREE
jgi:isopentenyl diphosphate isomerase/L-lactate dehydrogenase-like FMN-dependent dehydrogenase